MSEYKDVPAVVLFEERTVSEPESPQGEGGTTRAGRPRLRLPSRPRRWARSEPESPRGEWGTTRVLSEEWAQ
jgi:hypothetical protein